MKFIFLVVFKNFFILINNIFYRDNLTILMELEDRVAVGRTCGNLGNAYYLLGDFENATRYHQQVGL